MHAATSERPPDPTAAPRAAVRLPSWTYPVVTIISLLLGATSIVRGTRAVVSVSDSDLTNFFLRSADYILRGDPWHMYAVRALGGYPNYNPPLSIFLLAPLLGLARALGFAANYGEQITFVTLPFIVLVPVMGFLALRVMRALYPAAPETLRLLLYAFVTLSPLTWQSYSVWYHVEQPLMLCFLLGAALALQARREGLAGLLAGLAFLSRTTALIPLIALGVVLLMARDWRALLKFGGVSALVAALGFAPFFAFDASDVKYTFLTWRGGAPIGSDSIWTIFAYTGTSSHLRSIINAAAKRIDMYSVILVVVVAAFFAVRRLRITVYDRDIWALLAIATLATPMLSKQVWPYYYLEPLLFIVIWELSTLQDRVAGVWRWPALSITFTLVAGTLSQYIWLQSVGGLDRLLTGVTQTGLMLAFTLGVWARMQARKPVAAAGKAGGEAALAGMQGMQPLTPPALAAAGIGGVTGATPQPGPRDGRAGGMRPLPQPPAPGMGAAPSPASPYGAGQGQAPGQSPVAPATPLWPSDTDTPARGVGQRGALSGGQPAQSPQQGWRGPTPPQSPQSPQPPLQQPPQQGAPVRPAPGREGADQPPNLADPWRDWPQSR